MTPRLLLALLPLLLPVAPAHADPAGTVDTGLVLQGSLAYACYGCAPEATFSGIATWLGDNGPVTVPGSGTFSFNETCGATASGEGDLHLGNEDFTVYLSRTGNAVVLNMFGPGGFYRPDTGGGTLTVDGPAGTCGVPATASLTAVLVPTTNCYCMLAHDES